MARRRGLRYGWWVRAGEERGGDVILERGAIAVDTVPWYRLVALLTLTNPDLNPLFPPREIREIGFV